MAAWGKVLICIECKSTQSEFWEKSGIHDDVICGSCFSKRIPTSARRRTSVLAGTMPAESSMQLDSLQLGKASSSISSAIVSRAGSSNKEGGFTSDQAKSTRKSARLKPVRSKTQSNVKTQATKGRSRRNIFKKNPAKAPISTASVVTSDYLFYKGSYWQIGDIVSLMDHDGSIYYAQLRGFLQHQYFDKSAVITWLLPTMSSPEEGFDPDTYILGPEEETPRSMDCFEFVCHAPSQFFRFHNQLHPTKTGKPDVGFIWTRLDCKHQNL